MNICLFYCVFFSVCSWSVFDGLFFGDVTKKTVNPCHSLVFYDELNIETWGGNLLHAWMFTSLR